VAGERRLDLAQVFGILSAREVEDARIMNGNLQRAKAEIAGEGSNVGKALEQRGRPDELRNEQRRTVDLAGRTDVFCCGVKLL